MGKEKRRRKPEFSPQCFTVAFDVYPPIAMLRENALKLATDLAAHQDLSDIHMSDESWSFRRPQPKGHARGQIELTVEDQEIAIEHRTPNGGLERFEILVGQVAESVGAVLRPQGIWGTNVTLEYVANIGGDARKAILGSLDMLEDEDTPGKLDVFQRPCHFVGLRLGFPAFEYVPTEDPPGEEDEPGETNTGKLIDRLIENKGGSGEQQEDAPKNAEWHATLTLQSLQDDPKSLLVEVSGRWFGAVDWKNVSNTLATRLRTVDGFLRTKTSDFIQQFRSEE